MGLIEIKGDKNIIGAVSLAFGFIALYFSLRAFRIRRKIEDTPTSKVRSIAMGLVEVMGKVIAIETIRSPFLRKPCVYYDYRMEERRESRSFDSANKRWVTETRWVQVRAETESRRFFIEDETGRVLVEPKGIEVPDVTCRTQGRFRHTERLILPDSTIYLLGTAAENTEKGPSENSLENILIRKGEVDKDFIASSDGEKRVARNYGMQFEAGLVVSLILLAFGAWVILFY
jgi:hypothetical protein